MSHEQSDRFDRNSWDRNTNPGVAGIARDAYDPANSRWDWQRSDDSASGVLPALTLTNGSSPENGAMQHATAAPGSVEANSSSPPLSGTDDVGSTASPNLQSVDGQLGSPQNLPAELQKLETGIQQQLQQLAQAVSQLEVQLGVPSQTTQDAQALPAAPEAPATAAPTAVPTAVPTEVPSTAVPPVAPPAAVPPVTTDVASSANAAATLLQNSGDTAAATPTTVATTAAITTATTAATTADTAATNLMNSSLAANSDTALATPNQASGSIQPPAETIQPSTTASQAGSAEIATNVSAADSVVASSGVSGETGSPNTNQAEIGFYGGAGSPTLAEQMASALGQPVAVSDYLDMTQPAQQTVDWVTSQYSAWQAANPDTPIILGVPLTFQNQTLQQTASGANDQEFTDIAQQLVNSGMGNATIRLGWEMNGNWYPWGNDPTDYINAYNDAAEAMKSVPGANFSFDWNVSAGNPGGTPFQDYYPGSQNVNSIGIDAYDFDYADPNATPQQRWQSVLTEPGGLEDVENFAQQEGKPFAVPEWGLWQSGSSAGGGDDPYYINQMASYLQSVPDLAFQSYFGDTSGDSSIALASAPQSDAAYLSDFSSGSTVA